MSAASLAAAQSTATAVTSAQQRASTRVIDLGHPLSAASPSWSGKPTFERTGSPAMGRVVTDEHFGTHLDAPIHFGGEWTVDRIPVDRFVRPGICIAVAGKPEDAASYLRDRGIVGMGTDTPSVDHGPSETFATHRITNPAGIFHIENATNLTRLPARGFTVVVAPLNTVGGSGGPARVFALLP